MACRIICLVCGRSILVNQDGTLRIHNWPSNDPAAGVCSGSGEPVGGED